MSLCPTKTHNKNKCQSMVREIDSNFPQKSFIHCRCDSPHAIQSTKPFGQSDSLYSTCRCQARGASQPVAGLLTKTSLVCLYVVLITLCFIHSLVEIAYTQKALLYVKVRRDDKSRTLYPALQTSNTVGRTIHHEGVDGRLDHIFV